MKTFTVACAFVIAVTSASPAVGPWPAWIERLGWTLVHSVWQLAAVALVMLLVDTWVGRASARRRYLIATASLGLMLVMPAATWLIWTPSPVASSSAMAEVSAWKSSSPVAEAPVYDPQTNLPVDTGKLRPGELRMEPQPGVEDGSQEFASPPESDVAVVARQEAQRLAALRVERRPTVEVSTRTGYGGIEWVRAGIEARLEWLVWFWMAGVALFSCRPACGIVAEWHLRRTGRSPVGDSVEFTLRQLTRRMGISRTVSIAQSALVRVPLVIGYLRPLVLLPIGAIAELSPAQLEAILAHELSHIRRHDWLVNALQVLAETVLFYHPAVWWISRRVRQTRELCCDDLALELVADRAVFARALLMLEEFRLRERALSATILAATGGQLSARIRRLLPAPAGAEPARRSWWAGAVLLVSLGLTGGICLLANPLPKPVEAEESTDAGDDSDVEPGHTVKYSDEKRIDADTGMPELREATVVDEDGKPVHGARVRFQFEVTKHSLIIPLGPIKTDSRGVAYSEIPAEAERVGIYVNAAGFGEGSAKELATGKSRIVLKRGRVVLVRPVDGEGRFLKHAVPLLAGARTWGREFGFKEPDLYESPSVDLNRKYLRVACSQEDGSMLFSDLVDVTRDKPGPDGVFELKLTPGVRLTGRLDDSVPRPVHEGYVELAIVAGENGTLRGGELWEWNDFAPVRPDGTFTFESLPGGCHAQLHVLVDGYMSTNPPVPERLVYLEKQKLVDEEQLRKIKEYVDVYDFWPYFVALDRPQVEATIPCEPTAACDFLLLDPAGGPVPNASVSFNPNGVFVAGGLFIPGTENSTALLVDGLRTDHYADEIFGLDDPSPHGKEAVRRRKWAERSFLGASSDASGHVRVCNLPGGGDKTFRVSAPGFVLPVSPLLDADELAREKPEDDDDRDRNRFGMVNLQSGKTIEKTIYLERKQATVNRELTVVNRAGSPLEQVGLAVVELSTGENQWQTWSQQRFGPTPRGTTDRLGRLIIRLPRDIDGKNVERVRLGVNYFRRDGRSPEEEEKAPDKDLFISHTIVEVPLTPDDGLIVLLPNPDKPAGGGTRRGFVRYGRLEELLPGRTSADLLEALALHPNLAMLRALLAETKIRHPQPIELLDDSRRGSRPPGAKATGGVQIVSVGENQFTIVEARVRPLVAPSFDNDGINPLPECAYVFDQQGVLLAALGGEWGRTGSNSPDYIDVINLGPREDWFVRVSRFEQNKSFDYLTQYYRVGNPVTPALKLLHMSHSGGWSTGPQQTKRYGELIFDSPDVRDEQYHQELATLANGAKVISGFLWDGDRDRFIGPSASQIGGQPIYEVDAAWSKDFEALTPEPNQLVVMGGEYDYGNIWKMAVPDGMGAVVRLTLPQASGAAKVFAHRLGPGRQNVQLYFKADGDQLAAAVTHVELRLSDPKQAKKVANFKYPPLPDDLGDKPAENPPVIHTLNPQGTARLSQRRLKSGKDSIMLEITLLAPK
ncbi:MAG TPA: M56 family metallopeptidase [Pirellulales bacterium]|nr:M56 family metallopeptidase [Pirellulales bacterium]